MGACTAQGFAGRSSAFDLSFNREQVGGLLLVPQLYVVAQVSRSIVCLGYVTQLCVVAKAPLCAIEPFLAVLYIV